MSKKTRNNEYNRIVRLIEEGNKSIKMPERLLEEFGKYGKPEKKGEEKPLKENTDEMED